MIYFRNLKTINATMAWSAEPNYSAWKSNVKFYTEDHQIIFNSIHYK